MNNTLELILVACVASHVIMGVYYELSELDRIFILEKLRFMILILVFFSISILFYEFIDLAINTGDYIWMN